MSGIAIFNLIKQCAARSVTLRHDVAAYVSARIFVQIGIAAVIVLFLIHVFGEEEERPGLIAALIVIMTGLSLAALIKRVVGGLDGAIFATLLFLPLLTYAFVSGRLAKFSAPGGWAAEFREVANRIIPVNEGNQQGNLQDFDALQTFEKTTLDLLRVTDRLRPDAANGLILRRGKANYDYVFISRYLKALRSVGTDSYVIFVSADDTFWGSATNRSISELLDTEETRPALLDFLNGKESTMLQSTIVREYLAANDTNLEALRKFSKTNADALIVVSTDRKPMGVLTRKRLLTKFVLQLAEPALTK